MSIFEKCLLVSDIDGTLYCDGEIPAKNTEAIEYFKSQGGFFYHCHGQG